MPRTLRNSKLNPGNPDLAYAAGVDPATGLDLADGAGSVAETRADVRAAAFAATTGYGELVEGDAAKQSVASEDQRDDV